MSEADSYITEIPKESINHISKWDEIKDSKPIKIGNGYAIEIIAGLNTGNSIEGFICYAAHRWQFSKNEIVLHTWEVQEGTKPDEIYSEIEPFLEGIDNELYLMKNKFLRSQPLSSKEATKELAEKIWCEGKMLDYICGVCKEAHTGDERAVLALILSYVSTRVVNSDGIHISISGDAGTGKSHVTSTVSKCLPSDAVLKGRISDKALYYHKIKPKTVIIMDDQELTEDFQELFKVASTDWDIPAIYLTVSKNEPKEISLPTRCLFWICKANLNGDEQVLDRQLVIQTDDSPEQKLAIQATIKKKSANPTIIEEENDDIKVCQALWELISDEIIAIPFSDRINCSTQMDPRNFKLMLALIQSHALLHLSLRERNKEDIIQASEEDFIAATNRMNPLLKNEGGSQKLKISAAASKVLNYLAECNSGIISFSDIRRKTGLSQSQLTQALYGRIDRQTGGLLSTCSALEIVNYSETKSDEFDERRRSTISRKAVRWSRETYIVSNYACEGFWLRPEA